MLQGNCREKPRGIEYTSRRTDDAEHLVGFNNAIISLTSRVDVEQFAMTRRALHR